jgi:hypothetical protein
MRCVLKIMIRRFNSDISYKFVKYICMDICQSPSSNTVYTCVRFGNYKTLPRFIIFPLHLFPCLTTRTFLLHFYFYIYIYIHTHTHTRNFYAVVFLYTIYIKFCVCVCVCVCRDWSKSFKSWSSGFWRPEDGGSKVLRNVDIIHHYTAS